MFTLRNRKSPTARRIEPSLRSTFTDDDIASMAGLGTLVEIAAGNDLMTEGTAGTHAFFITAGSAAVRRGDTVIAMLSSGDLVGERAVVTGDERNATVTALTPVTALQFDRQQFSWLRLESSKAKDLSNTLIAARR